MNDAEELNALLPRGWGLEIRQTPVFVTFSVRYTALDGTRWQASHSIPQKIRRAGGPRTMDRIAVTMARDSLLQHIDTARKA